MLYRTGSVEDLAVLCEWISAYKNTNYSPDIHSDSGTVPEVYNQVFIDKLLNFRLQELTANENDYRKIPEIMDCGYEIDYSDCRELENASDIDTSGTKSAGFAEFAISSANRLPYMSFIVGMMQLRAAYSQEMITSEVYERELEQIARGFWITSTREFR